MARATNDLSAVRNLLGPAIMYTANTIVLMAGALGFMVSISPRLTLYTFLPLPAASILIQYFGRRIHERFERIQAMFSDISARAQENFSGARLIRAYVQEEAEIRLRKRKPGIHPPQPETGAAHGHALANARIDDGLRRGARAMAGRTRSAERSHQRRPIRFLQHLHDATDLAHHRARLCHQPVPARHRIAGALNEIMQEQARIKDSPGVQDLENDNDNARQIAGEIEFRGLNFSYEGKPVLHDLNLRIPAGSSLAIVGPTGSGKTTLVSLIPRIYDADPGTVLIDGRPIREYSLASLRRNIGFVPQETFLFSDRIRENIALGVNTATDAEIHNAAEAANIATDIESFPEGYDTMVGERGITLSGGQKQRTAIARALIRNPKILILDDALSSVDTHTEDKILNHLRDVMRGRTTIFISHRVSTVRNADRIAVLHGGRIVELGTHDELLALNGYYSDLYNKQLLEEELAEV
jgi:ATP-binding cassette, subfamily B, multidrug efflux pump